ncbi:hypothetical protein [Paraburkholderia sp.]|uniref:hypothetical protein n=1 Tax=Paraburkholderia sp. TaxID=1926495 RepID=UPI002F3E715F
MNIHAHTMPETEFASRVQRGNGNARAQQCKLDPQRIQLVAIAECVRNIINASRISITHVFSPLMSSRMSAHQPDSTSGDIAHTIPARRSGRKNFPKRIRRRARETRCARIYLRAAVSAQQL